MRGAGAILACALAVSAGASPVLAQDTSRPSGSRIEVERPPTEPQPQPAPGTAAPLVIQTPADSATAQGFPPIMTIDPDAVFAGSTWGQRVQGDLEAQKRQIATENERLANQFTAEEQQLTTLRATLTPEEFRQRADEFDTRVSEVRRERDAVTRDLQTHVDDERAAFFRAMLPVLSALMQERGAAVVLDQRAIFVSAQSADVTQMLIQRLDQEIGTGPVQPAQAGQAEQGADQTSPAPTPTPAP